MKLPSTHQKFKGFANVWTPVERAEKLANKPLPLVVAGEKIVLFRDASGRAAALLDRCPHRGVALSMGQVEADGTLSCPFHGWRFAADGACTHVPLNPRARCELLSATALATHEAGGLIWIYTAPGQTPNAPPLLHESLTDNTFARKAFIKNWRTHWTRAMENMLDLPHLPFVHRTTIGTDLHRRMRDDSEMEVTWEPTTHGGRIRASLDGLPDDGLVEFAQPNHMILHVPAPNRRLILHIFCVPQTAETTRMIFVSARDFARWMPIGSLINWFNARVALQDQPIVETSSPAEVPPPSQERSVSSDKPTLQFRKYYYTTLREPDFAHLQALRDIHSP